MKKTILIQLVILFAFSTFSMAQRVESNIPFAVTGINMNPTCATNFVMGQPANGSIKTIEALTQGYRDTNGNCVFDVNLYVPSYLPMPQNVKWQIDGVTVATLRQITIPVPDNASVVSVTYTIGSQQGSSSRTFFVQ